jgi:biofilm PGA synthesis N-glycosyltransferase PgaC
MSGLEILFWVCAACVVYTYVAYPLCLAVLARQRAPSPKRGRFIGSVSIVIAARNEEGNIVRRLSELAELVRGTGRPGEVILVSDGSTDRTAELARELGEPLVRVLELSRHLGKAAALTQGCALAVHDVLVFADARQRWAPDALNLLLENFADPSVGAVSGDLVVEAAPGVMAGVGLYWRYEKWLRQQECRLHSTVGVTGAISGVRRKLFHGVPAGTLLDDVYWPLRVVMQGYRVIHDGRARAYDRLPKKPRDEFRRKVRTLSGNFQLVTRLPAVLMPRRNPLWLQFVSHKLLRLVVPWALLGLLVASALLPGWGYHLAFGMQVSGYLLGLIALTTPAGQRYDVAGAAGSFLVLNTAAWLSVWVWASGRAGRSWRQVEYQVTEPAKEPALTGHP